VGKHTAETQSQRSDLLQPFPLSRAELGRAVHDKSVADYLALVKLVCIRLWLRVYGHGLAKIFSCSRDRLTRRPDHGLTPRKDAEQEAESLNDCRVQTHSDPESDDRGEDDGRKEIERKLVVACGHAPEVL
jgi:hypothetical protein